MCLGRARRRRLSLPLRPRRLLPAFGPSTALRRHHGRHGARGVVSASPGPASRTLTVPVSGGGGVGVRVSTLRGGSAGRRQPFRYSEVLCGSRPHGSPLIERRLPGLALHLLSGGAQMWRAQSQRDRLCNYGWARVLSGVASVEDPLGT